MDTMSAFAMGEQNIGKEMMVFDWNKAAEFIKQHQPKEAIAGLSMDMEYTSGVIYRDGNPITENDFDCMYLASTWATPVLVLDDGKEIPCFKMESELPGWGAKTRWPKSALHILNS